VALIAQGLYYGALKLGRLNEKHGVATWSLELVSKWLVAEASGHCDDTVESHVVSSTAYSKNYP
jgi:hypothetical protein